MSQLVAFTKKEFTEIYRTSKLMILIIIFAMFGIMNPAIAKLTPWMFEMLGKDLEEQGIVITNIEVTALTSWQQYYKNISMSIIVIVLMLGGILVNEYQKGTLINMLTKGLPRWKVIASKSIMAVGIWSFCYWMGFGITYFYTEYFWGNDTVTHVFLSAALVYLLGVWAISLIMLSSSIFNSTSAVLLITAGAFAISYIASMIPKIADYLPTKLLSSGSIVDGTVKIGDFYGATIVTIVLIIVGFAGSVMTFNKKRI